MNSGKKIWLRLAAGLVALGVLGVSMAAPSAPVQGEVRRVSPAERKITLKHDPIPELELPAMTLVFQVVEVSVLKDVKPGDRVIFTADRVNGQYTVISIRKQGR